MKIATFDTESDDLLEKATILWCAVVKDHSTGEVKEFTPENIHELCTYLQTYDVLIGHNCIAFDFPLLRKLYGWEYKGKRVDTLLMSRLQRPNRVMPPHCPNKMAGPHSVEAWGYRLGRYKVGHEDWSQFSQEMLVRCREDVEIQYLIYKTLLEEGKGEGWANAHKLNSKLFYYLQRQEEHGWFVDSEHIDRCIVLLDRWIDKIDRAITPHLPVIVEIEEIKKGEEYSYVSKPFKKSGELSKQSEKFLQGLADRRVSVCGPFSRVQFRHVSPNSNMEIKDFLLDLGWQPSEWNTNNAGQRTSPKFSKDDEFIGIQGALGRLIARRIQCRQRKSVLEGWKSAIRVDGRIGAAVAGMATTGRIRHKGVVNVPNPNSKAFFAKQMRQVFIASPGKILIGTDSKGNQMRQLAARMGDEEFTKAVLFGNSKDGTDLHSLNQKRSGVDNRTKAKNFFYGCILFGAGDAKTAKVIGGTKEQGRKLKEDYFKQMPKLRALLDREIEKWRKTAKKVYIPKYNRWEYKDGYIKGLDGRPILVEQEKDILVYYLQSDEAIQMAMAYVWLNEQIEQFGYIWGKDYGFNIWMHDEWQFECRPEIAPQLMELSNQAIKWAGEYYKIACPHEGESKIGKNWYETH